MGSIEEIRARAKKFFHEYPRPTCLGYPLCDGEMPGEPHIENCPAKNGKPPKPINMLADFAQSYNQHLLERVAKLEAGLLKLKSYNEDIAANKINYRPKDHIFVADVALAEGTCEIRQQ